MNTKTPQEQKSWSSNVPVVRGSVMKVVFVTMIMLPLCVGQWGPFGGGFGFGHHQPFGGFGHHGFGHNGFGQFGHHGYGHQSVHDDMPLGARYKKWDPVKRTLSYHWHKPLEKEEAWDLFRRSPLIDTNLTEDNFRAKVRGSKSDSWLVLFCPWCNCDAFNNVDCNCEHCGDVGSGFMDAVTRLEGVMQSGVVDCASSPKVMKLSLWVDSHTFLVPALQVCLTVDRANCSSCVSMA